MEINLIILAAFGAMFFWGVGDFLVQKISRELGSFESLIWINLAGCLILLPFAVNDFANINSQNILPLILLTIVDFIFAFALLKAYEKGKLSIVEVILTMELPLTILLGIAVFKESPTVLQWILMGLIILGALIISKGEPNFFEKIKNLFWSKRIILEKGALLALSAALLSALYNFFIAYNARDISPVMSIWFPWTMSLLILLIVLIYKRSFSSVVNNFKKNKKLIIAGSVLEVLAWLFYAIAISKKELSIVTAITESYPALAIILGVVINKEKISKLQYVGATMALGASIAIAFIS